MKSVSLGALLAWALTCSQALAAFLEIEPAEPSPAGIDSLYLHGDSPIFSNVSISIKADAGGQLSDVSSGNVNGAPRPAGDTG